LTARLASLVCAVLVTAAAGVSFQRVFGFVPLLPTLATATVIPGALSAATSAGPRRLPLWAAIAASCGGWLLVACAVILRAAPGPGALAAVRAGVSDGWWLMLTTILPAPATPRFLLGVHLVLWLGTLAAAETVLRTTRVLPAVLPGLAILLAGLVFGAAGPGSGTLPVAGALSVASTLPVAGMLLFAGLLLVTRTAAGRGASGQGGWRPLAQGTALVAAISAIALTAGPRLPLAGGRGAFDPRRYVHAVSVVRTVTSPLDSVPLWLGEPRRELFRVSAAAPQDWRLAVLDRFDGQTWSASGGFTDTGGRIPPAPGPPAPTPVGGPVTQTVTIQGLAGPWLPAAGRPAAVTGVPVDVDPVTGVLLDRAPLTAGQRYRVVSALPALDQAALRDAAAADDASARADLARPAGAPPVIARTAQAATARAAFPFQQAVLLASYLFGHEEFDPSAPPGHSYGAIGYFLGTSHRGTSEQFAAAYALMARTLGLPSRIVVGFRPGQLVTPGTWQVDGADALVWPEVDFARIGWVAFYPTPATPGRAPAGGVPAGQTAARQRLDQRIGDAPPAPVRGRSPEAGTRGPAARRGPAAAPRPALWYPWPVVAAGVLVLGYPSAVLAVPVWRRRRRRGGDPAARVTGAWAEALDGLRSAGLRPSVAQSAPEVAALGSVYLGARAEPALTDLAVLADRARFAPFPVDDAAAYAAWDRCETIRRELAARTSRRTRLAVRLSPKILLPRLDR
jgi:hypothetical protein